MKSRMTIEENMGESVDKRPIAHETFEIIVRYRQAEQKEMEFIGLAREDLTYHMKWMASPFVSKRLEIHL